MNEFDRRIINSEVDHEMPATITGYSVAGRERSYRVTPIDQDAYLPKGAVVTVFTAAGLAAHDAEIAAAFGVGNE